jgi:hypothetical protein
MERAVGPVSVTPARNNPTRFQRLPCLDDSSRGIGLFSVIAKHGNNVTGLANLSIVWYDQRGNAAPIASAKSTAIVGAPKLLT